MKNHLRQLRLMREWRQEDLADALGVSRQTIYALEHGRYDPSLPLALKIAKLFERRVEEIWELEES